MVGDLFIELYEDGWTGGKRIARINYNPYFLNPSNDMNQKDLFVEFPSTKIKCNKSTEQNFVLTLNFEYYCPCHMVGGEVPECPCFRDREIEEGHWHRMTEQIQDMKYFKAETINSYFFNQHCHLENCVKKEENPNPMERRKNSGGEDEFVH